MPSRDETRAERLALLLDDARSHGDEPLDAGQRVFLDWFETRVHRWCASRPDELRIWSGFQASSYSWRPFLSDLLLRLMAGDPSARHLAKKLVPPSGNVARQIQYKDLVLAFEDDLCDGERVTVRAREAPFPLEGGHPLDVGAVIGFHSLPPRQHGDALFRALFQDGLRDAWLASRGALRGRPDYGLRLRLVFDVRSPTVRRLAAQPWEFLHDPLSGLPLCKEVQTPVVRSLETVSRPRYSLPAARSVLVLGSMPRGQGGVNATAERRTIEDALRDLRKVDVRSASARIDQLRSLGSAHVVHFTGHGEFDVARQEGALIFEGEDEFSVPVPAKTFVEQLGHPRPELVVLSACRSGENNDREGGDPFSGVAASLLEAGVPTVVAMQEPISDAAARRFTTALYQQLAHRSPLTAAVTEGRLAISRDEGADSDEWAKPALYVGGS